MVNGEVMEPGEGFMTAISIDSNYDTLWVFKTFQETYL